MPSVPLTSADLQAMWRAVLPEGARRVLDQLVSVWPAGLSREELAVLSKYSEGGAFKDALKALRDNGLMETVGKLLYASSSLFLEGEGANNA